MVDEVGAEGVTLAQRFEDDVADVEWGEVRDRDWHAGSVAIRSLFRQSPLAYFGRGDWGFEPPEGIGEVRAIRPGPGPASR